MAKQEERNKEGKKEIFLRYGKVKQVVKAKVEAASGSISNNECGAGKIGKGSESTQSPSAESARRIGVGSMCEGVAL